MTNNYPSWDEKFLSLAFHVSTWSKDPSTKVGAVIVNSRNQVLSLGYNGFPRGIEDNAERLNDRPKKYELIAHAERNALDNAECSVVDAKIYATLCPCIECAKSIVQRGIKEVISPIIPENYERWSFEKSIALFEEAKVILRFVPFDQKSGRFKCE